MEPLLKCGEIKSPGQLITLTHDMQLNLIVSVWEEKDDKSERNATIRITDVNSGNLVSQSTFKNWGKKQISCAYHPFLDKLVVSDGSCLSVRRDTNGRFLLATVFTCPVASSSDEISLELLLPHAIQLKDVIDYASTCSTAQSISELGGSSRKLNFNLIGSQLQEVLNQITPESSSVVLKLRQSTFCSLLYWLLNILGDLMNCGNHLRNRILSNAPTPPLHTSAGPADPSQTLKPSPKSGCLQQPHSLLPVVSSMYLQAIMSLSDPYNEIPKEHMFAEVFRYETFLEWPHIEYEWAGPSSMALAGFYYQPACRAEDRAVCFQCGVSLVSWEPTDEPWSEHERHAPACAMVTGDITSNVPLSESESFEPAQAIFSSVRCSPSDQPLSASPAGAATPTTTAAVAVDDSKVHLLVSSSDGIVVTTTSSGTVVLWDATRRLRKCASFCLIADIRGNQTVPSSKEKGAFSCFCLPDVNHATSSYNEGECEAESRAAQRKSSLSKNRTSQNVSDDEYVRIIAGGAFGEQNELFVLEYILEPPLWADSRCQTEGARSGAQPPFTSSSSAPLNDQYHLLQYDMWDDESPPSPPYEENSEDNDDEQVGVDEDTNEATLNIKTSDETVTLQIEEEDGSLQSKFEKQVEGAAISVISEPDDHPGSSESGLKSVSGGDNKGNNGKDQAKQEDSECEIDDVPPPDVSAVAAVFNAGDQDMDMPIPEPSISGLGGPVRQVFITKQQPSGGTEPVFAKRVLKLPEMFQSTSIAVSAIHHSLPISLSSSETSKQQRLIVILNDSQFVPPQQHDTNNECCWACSKQQDSDGSDEPNIGGIVVYKFRPSLRRGVNAAEQQHFDHPTAVYTIPSFLTSQLVHRAPHFVCSQSPDSETKSFTSSPCCYLLNLLPGANAVAIYALSLSATTDSVTALSPITTLLLAPADIGSVDGSHITKFIYCPDVDTIVAGSCQGQMSFWKKVAPPPAVGLASKITKERLGDMDAKSEQSAASVAAEMAEAASGAGGISYCFDTQVIRQLLKISHAIRLDQRYTVSCPNGWSEMVGDQASRMHPGGLGTDLSPTRAGCGPNQPTRSFVRHSSCIRDTYDITTGPSSGSTVVGEGPCYSSFDIAFTHSLHVSHVVASFGFDPLDCSLEDCKIYLLRQKDTWGSIKFGNLRPNSLKPSTSTANSARVGLHALQTSFDLSSFEVLCGPVEVSQYVLRNDQPGVNASGSSSSSSSLPGWGAVKAVVMLTSPELFTASSRSLTVLVEYSAGSIALAAAYNQQQYLLTEGSVIGSTTPPPPNAGTQSVSATLSLTPMYLPKYKQITGVSSRHNLSMGIDLADLLFSEKCQSSFFAHILSFVRSQSNIAVVEIQAAVLDSFTLLLWLFSVSQCQYTCSARSAKESTFYQLANKVIDNFDLLAQIAFVMPSTSSREVATVMSEIILLIDETLAARQSTTTNQMSVAPLIERLLDGIFVSSVISLITSPTVFHLFLKLASRLAELHLVSSSSALPACGFAKLAALSEILSVQTRVERVPLVSDETLTASPRIFDFPLPSHLLETFPRPSYAAVVAGIFGHQPSGFNSAQVIEPVKSPGSTAGPWATMPQLLGSDVVPTSLQGNAKVQLHQQSSEATQPNMETTYSPGPRHIFGLIEYECLHFHFHKFCQGARPGSPRSGFKVAPPPSVKLPSNAAGLSAATATTAMGGGGLDAQWPLPSAPSGTQQVWPLVDSYFPAVTESNVSNLFGSSDAKKTYSSTGLMFTVDEVPSNEEGSATVTNSNVPLSAIYVPTTSSVPPTPKPTPYITPSVTPPNELSSVNANVSSPTIMPSILPNSVSVPSQLHHNGSGNTVSPAVDVVSLGHNFDYLANLLVLDYCNNWVAFDRSSASSRRFVDLDFGRPVVLTGFIIPVNSDVLSVAIDVWMKPDDDKQHRAKRICNHTRLRHEPLIMLNLQPAPVCRYIRLWTLFAVGATQGRLSMCVGQYYGYSLMASCRLSSIAMSASLIGPSINPPSASPSLSAVLQPLVKLHSSVIQTCIEDQMYRFREAMSDMNTVSQVYANPSQVAGLWASGQRAIETRLRVCVGGAFVWRCQLNHCASQASDIRAFLSSGDSSNIPDLDGCHEPFDKLQLVFYYLLRMFFVQARLGLHVNVSLTDASRLFQTVCLFAHDELRAAVGQLIVHFAADVEWWHEFFANGLQKLFSSYTSSPDITALTSSINTISLSDYCNLFILLIEANPDQANNVVTFMLEKLRSSLASPTALSDTSNVGMVLFLSICLDALLSPNHWLADLWSFAPVSLSSVKAQWTAVGGSASSTGNGPGGSNATNANQPTRQGSVLNRRGAVYKKKISKLNRLAPTSISKSSSSVDHVRFSVGSMDDAKWVANAIEDVNLMTGAESVNQATTSILTRLPVELCKDVAESLLTFVLDSHMQSLTSSQSAPTSMVFADVHALKLAACLSCFSTPELTLSSIFSSKPDSLADLLHLVIFLKENAVSGGSNIDATRNAIRAHAVECFLKTVLLAEKISRKTAASAATTKETIAADELQGPFTSLFAAIKEQEDAPRSSTEDLFNRFFGLLHATRCNQLKEKSLLFGKPHRCKAAECQPAKKLIDHWSQCSDVSSCSYKNCIPLRLLVNHWRTCKRFDSCVTCKELAKFPLVFEPTVMNSIENIAECPSLPDDGNGIVPPPEIDTSAISTTLADLLFADEAELNTPLDVCYLDEGCYSAEGTNQPQAGYATVSSTQFMLSSPPLPPFAVDCRFDFSLLHHAKYLLDCLQARNYAEIATLPALLPSSSSKLRSQQVQCDEKQQDSSGSTDTSAAETSSLIYRSLSRCLASGSAKSLSSLAKSCEIVNDLLSYTKTVKAADGSSGEERMLVIWYETIIDAILKAPAAVNNLQYTFEEMISLNTVFLETCNFLLSKTNGSLMANFVIDIFSDSQKLPKLMSSILLISDLAVFSIQHDNNSRRPQRLSTNGGEYGPAFCQTFVSFLRGVLEVSVEQMALVGSALAKCLCGIVAYFIDGQLVGGHSVCTSVDFIVAILPFLVEMCKGVNVFSSSGDGISGDNWIQLGTDLIKVISLTCSLLPRTETIFRNRITPASGSGSGMPQSSSSSLTKVRGRGRGLYAHRWDEAARGPQGSGDVVVMRVPPTNNDLVKCAYPETATAFGSLLSDELALIEQILSKKEFFHFILGRGSTFSYLLSILYWNGICCQSATSIAAADPSSPICTVEGQQTVSALGAAASKICQNIFNMLVDNFADSVGKLLLSSVCCPAQQASSVGWDTRSAALVIVQAVLDKTPDTASEHRDVICEILFSCFEEIINVDKLSQSSRLSSSKNNKIFDLSPLARVINGSVNLPLANLISQQYHAGSHSSASASSRSQRLFYELVNATSKSGAPCPVFDGTGNITSMPGDPRPLPIPTSQRSSRSAPAICGYTFAPGEDHFSFAVHFSLPVVLAEVVVGCELSHSRGHLPQAIEVEVRSDKQSSFNTSLPLRFSAVSPTSNRSQSPRDCIAVGINPPHVASSILISIYRPKSAYVIYLNMISIRGFLLTSGPVDTPQVLAEVDRISPITGQSSISPTFGLPLSSNEVTFLSLLHSVTTFGRLKLLSTTEMNATGFMRLASCSAYSLMAPSSVITPTILQNLLEMINICVDSLHDETSASKFVCSIVDVFVKLAMEEPNSATSASPSQAGVDMTPFCLFIYSLAHWRTSFISRQLATQLIKHILSALERIDSWYQADVKLLPMTQCLAYLIWQNNGPSDFTEGSLTQLFEQSLKLAVSSPCGAAPYWPTPVQALSCAILNHQSVAFEDMANSFISTFLPLVNNLEVEVLRYDIPKAALLLQPLVNAFMSPRCLPWLLTSSAIVQDIIRFLGTPTPGPLSACALGFATALCRSVVGCSFVSQTLTENDWQQLLHNAVNCTSDFRYQDLALNFFSTAALTNSKNQMQLGAAFASLLRSSSSLSNSANNSGPLAGSMPCFMRAFCHRLLLADSEVAFYCTPDFDDPSTIIFDTDIVPFAGFPMTCLTEFVPPAYSSSVRLSGPGRCVLLDLMTRSKRHHQLATSGVEASSEDTVTTKAAKMFKIASIAKRRTSKDLGDSDSSEELKVLGSLRDLCVKFAQEGGLERDAVSASIAWRPPARWLIKKCFYAPRRQGDQPIPPTCTVRSLLVGFADNSLSAFYSTPLLELSGFAALPTASAEQTAAASASSSEDALSPTIPHVLSAFAQVGGLDALALFFPIPSSTTAANNHTYSGASAVSSLTGNSAVLPTFEPASAGLSVMAALMDPGNNDLPDDWVDIQDMDSDSTIEFTSPKNVIVLGGPGGVLNPTSLLASTASTLGLNSTSLMVAQRFFLPISALALRVFSRLPDLANLLTSPACLPLTQAALRLALGLGFDMVQLQHIQGGSSSAGGSSSSSASTSGGIMKAFGLLPSLPFLALDEFICTSPNNISSCLDAGCVDLLLAAIHVLSRQQDSVCSQANPFVALLLFAAGSPSSSAAAAGACGSKAHRAVLSHDLDEYAASSSSGQHWAKGTGFGSGPTSANQSMDARFLLARQRQEEQLLTLCFRLISRFIASSSQLAELPHVERMFSLISHSCFVKILSSYLQNDSIMDVSRHILLYESALNLWTILVDEEITHGHCLGLHEACSLMSSLLASFEESLSAYIGTLRVITASSTPPTNAAEETSSSANEPLATSSSTTLESDLDPLLVAVRRAAQSNAKLAEMTKRKNNGAENAQQLKSAESDLQGIESMDSRYASALKHLQFRSWQVVTTSGSGSTPTFIAKVPYHFIGNMSSSGFSSSASRARRIAQETVSLRSSLPLSLSSSVFVVVDEARLDVIKVLITGPSDTPYANGCFEFDISLPTDYPASPPLVHLCTTGNGQVRFNPNLYNDGKVCLSVLNTWHGRPEEKWNPQTSSLLQVLVSIQSLILVSEPYFNEPGYERSRGSMAAKIASAEYSAEIMAQTLKWAVVEQLRHPSACFADVVKRHFATKRSEVLAQCDRWIDQIKSMGSDSGSGGATSGPSSDGGLFSGSGTGSSDVVLIGSSGRRFQQMLTTLKRSIDQVREELKTLDSLVKSGDVFGDKQK